MTDIMLLFIVVVIAIIAYVGIDLWYPNRTMSNLMGGLLIILLGVCFILYAINIWFNIMAYVIQYGNKVYISILEKDFGKLITSGIILSIGNMLIGGGFTLITGGKYELKLTSSESISGIEIKK